jgi:hypothetical protein
MSRDLIPLAFNGFEETDRLLYHIVNSASVCQHWGCRLGRSIHLLISIQTWRAMGRYLNWWEAVSRFRTQSGQRLDHSLINNLWAVRTQCWSNATAIMGIQSCIRDNFFSAITKGLVPYRPLGYKFYHIFTIREQ